MMNKKTRKKLAVFIVLMVVFLLFSVAVHVIDVQPIGPNDTSIGFAKLNGAFHEKVCGGTSVQLEPFYKVSKYLGLLALALVGFFGVIGLIQLIRRKSLLKVDYRILTLGVFYIIILVLYVVFSKLPINYRPILEPDGTLEPSFPSSHTLMATTVFGSAMMMWPKMLGKPVGNCVSVLSGFAGAVLIVTRTLSGVHWLTDIIGSLLLAAALLAAYATAVSYIHGKKKKKHRRHHHSDKNR